MNEQNQPEIWQVEVAGNIYEANFDELQEWVNEGSLQPDDKVRRGNLRWIEAKRVPALIPFFNAKTTGVVPNLHVNTVKNEPPVSQQPTPVAAVTSIPSQSKANAQDSVASIGKTEELPNVCHRHKDAPSFYLCDGCGNGYCKACPSSYGGSVKICPDCGQMCRGIETEVKLKNRSSSISGMDGSFGLGDLINAFAYPFKYKPSLVLGGFMYMVFTLGQSARGIGGIILTAAALICFMLANTLTFGVLSYTIGNFAQGKFDTDFMPAFDDFSIWDDVLHPFFLSVATYLVSFGPFVLTMLAAMYLVMSSVANQVETFQTDLQKIPGTPYYDGREVGDQSVEVAKVVTKDPEETAKSVERETLNAEFGDVVGKDRETLDQEKLWQKIRESRKDQMESVVGQADKQQQFESQAMIAGMLKLAGPLVIVGMITFLWGVFFFPAACMVAGYTRSFFATLNPLVGLDTIKRLGFDYVKTLLMAFLLVIVLSIIAVPVALLFYPFNMPGVGNLPATAVNALVSFYFSVVFSCLLGFLLYKTSGRLKLPGK